MEVYFTSEAAAREGELKEPPPELKVQMLELAALSVGEPEFFDSSNPGCTPHAELARPPWGADILDGGWARAGERLTLPPTVASDLGKRRSAQRWAATYSHGGSRGFKSRHLHPSLMTAETLVTSACCALMAAAQRIRTPHFAAAKPWAHCCPET
jgi:hypothetical protein